MGLSEKIESKSSNQLVYIALALATISICLSLFLTLRTVGTPTSIAQQPDMSSLERIKKTGVMRVGYGGFPPYTIVDPKETDPNKRVTGFAADMVNEIAKRYSPPLKVEWYNLNWETFRADMSSNKFDFLADAVYATVPKVADYGLTDPFSYFGIAAAVVRIGDNRFKTFQDLDRPDIKIALAQGYVSTDYAIQELKKPTLKQVTVGKDAFVQMDEVLIGRADVALNDVPTVVQYVRAHPKEVKALWVDAPPSSVYGSFVTRREDRDLLSFLNASIRIITVDGTLDKLDKKWKSIGYFEKVKLTPGAGLSASTEK